MTLDAIAELFVTARELRYFLYAGNREGDGLVAVHPLLSDKEQIHATNWKSHDEDATNQELAWVHP
jgi:hypothetical protein